MTEFLRKVGPLLVGAALLAGCAGTTTTDASGSKGSTGSTGSTAKGSTGSTATGSNVAHTRPACSVPAVEPVKAAPVPDVASDVDLTSFDGTVIRAHWFPVDGSGTAPTVLMGPGWSLPGDTNVDAVGVLGAVNIHTLREAGFNVLTWDPRGFGKSGGQAEVNAPEFEGRDVQRLIDWVSAQPGVTLDGAGDPRMGMVGGSYGGGIQFVAAGIDCRVDAIVPVIAWHSLDSSLYKGEISKLGWGGVLSKVAGTRPVNSHVTSANEAAVSKGQVTEEDRAYLAARTTVDLLDHIDIPTLVVQGTVDTLFTLDEGVKNFTALHDRGVPAAMLWYCGGHGTCLTDPGDPERVATASIGWLRRYVKDETTVALGSPVDLLDQDGRSLRGDTYPLPAGPTVTAEGPGGTLALVAEGGAGPIAAGSSDDMLAPLVQPITPGPATNSVDLAIPPAGATATIVGTPTVHLSYTGTADAGERPTRVFAQLVDRTTGVVLGNQITPIAVTLDGQRHEVTVPLEIVAFTPHADSELVLQIVATTVAYAPPRLGGSVTFDAVRVELPTTTVTPR